MQAHLSAWYLFAMYFMANVTIYYLPSCESVCLTV